MPTMMKTHQPAGTHRSHRAPRPPPPLPYDRRWMRLRRMVLARQPFCADPFGHHAEDGQRRVPGEQVDHILPRRKGGPDSFENLQTLCASCHSRKTALYDGGFGRTRSGIARRGDRERSKTSAPETGSTDVRRATALAPSATPTTAERAMTKALDSRRDEWSGATDA